MPMPMTLDNARIVAADPCTFGPDILIQAADVLWRVWPLLAAATCAAYARKINLQRDMPKKN